MVFQFLDLFPVCNQDYTTNSLPPQATEMTHELTETLKKKKHLKVSNERSPSTCVKIVGYLYNIKMLKTISVSSPHLW